MPMIAAATFQEYLSDAVSSPGGTGASVHATTGPIWVSGWKVISPFRDWQVPKVMAPAAFASSRRGDCFQDAPPCSTAESGGFSLEACQRVEERPVLRPFIWRIMTNHKAANRISGERFSNKVHPLEDASRTVM